jgi:hypothetical protein
MTEREPTGGDKLQPGSTTALGVLATSLAMRLTLDEIELLWRDLKERAEEKRHEAAGGQLPVLAGYRDVWEPVRDVA